MPPFFFADDEDDEPEPGVPEDAVPALEALAANNGLRDLSLRRFEADEPPPYESSTEPEDLGHHDLLDPPAPAPVPVVQDSDSIPNPGGVPEDVLQTLERPLSDAEMDSIATAAHHLLSPAEVFYGDALREDERMPFSESFRETVGLRRAGMVVRHVLKNRWRKLGVWNPAWGFAGRNVTPADRYRDWRWPWERQGAGEREAVEANRKELVLRALRERRHLHRGEYVPGPPQARLEPDSSLAQAESFLISRPWFEFRLERFEDTMRYNRLDQATRLQYKGRLGPSVKERWQERGEWRKEFGLTPGFDIERVTSWKWRHESPSPEPEDLSCITKPLQPVGLRYYHDDLHFTPSEYDEIEVLERLREDRPENSWIVQDSDFDQPPIPGQVHREVEERSSGRLFADNDDSNPTAAAAAEPAGAHRSVFGSFGIGNIFGRAVNKETPSQRESTEEPEMPDAPESPEDAADAEELEGLEESEELPLSSPTDLVRDQSKQSDSATSPPAPRQSARAAATSRKREADAPLPEPDPPKRARRTKATPAAAAKEKKTVPSASKTGGPAKRGRPAGRPRKSLVQEPEPETQKDNAPVKQAAETPARRGRPPKEQPEAAPSTPTAKASKKAAAAKPTARRGRPSKSVTPAKPSVAVTKAKQRVTAKVVGKRGRPSARTQASAEENPAASVTKGKARSAAAAATAATPQETPRRGRPARAQAQSQPEEKVPSTTTTKAAKKSVKPAAPEEPIAPRRAGRPARAAPAAAVVPAKSKQTAPEEEVVATVTPNRRGRPAKAAAAKTAPAAVTEKTKSEEKEITPPKEETATPRRGRPSKAQGLEKKTAANAAVAAVASVKSKEAQVAAPTEDNNVPTPRRGRPSKAATLAAAAAAAKVEDDKPAAPEEEAATPRARGRPGKKAAVPAEAPVSEKKSKQPAAPEEGVDTPRRRGRPARQQPVESQEEEPAPAPTPVVAAPAVNGTSATKKKAAGAIPNKKAAAAATPQRALSGRVTKRAAVTNSSSKAKASKVVSAAASPATRGRGRPKKA
ncbi:hypothetical protein PG984_014198 [Apiospora sp. TS-2023a]